MMPGSGPVSELAPICLCVAAPRYRVALDMPLAPPLQYVGDVCKLLVLREGKEMELETRCVCTCV